MASRRSAAKRYQNDLREIQRVRGVNRPRAISLYSAAKSRSDFDRNEINRRGLVNIVGRVKRVPRRKPKRKKRPSAVVFEGDEFTFLLQEKDKRDGGQIQRRVNNLFFARGGPIKFMSEGFVIFSVTQPQQDFEVTFPVSAPDTFWFSFHESIREVVDAQSSEEYHTTLIAAE